MDIDKVPPIKPGRGGVAPELEEAGDMSCSDGLGVKRTGDPKVDGRKVVPEGMEEAYQNLKEVARTAKRNDHMDPTWWINMCKWAWDQSVPD